MGIAFVNKDDKDAEEIGICNYEKCSCLQSRYAASLPGTHDLRIIGTSEGLPLLLASMLQRYVSMYRLFERKAGDHLIH
jgi:hypothetical protein